MTATLVTALAVVGILAAIACSRAIMRIAARSYAPLVATLAALLIGAALCIGISMSKDTGFLTGLTGSLFFWLLVCVAAGSVLGALMRFGWRWAGREDRATQRTALNPAWDLIGFTSLSLIATTLSATE